MKKIIGWILIVLGILNFVAGLAMVSDGVAIHGSQTAIGKFIFGIILVFVGRKIIFSDRKK